MSEAPGPRAASRQFVTFWVRDEIFGVPLAEVQEIIRMPGVVRVPRAPGSLEGIANLRGAVLPITSLRRVFGMRDGPHDDATRVVVINRGALSGFVVDRMASVITTDMALLRPTRLCRRRPSPVCCTSICSAAALMAVISASRSLRATCAAGSGSALPVPATTGTS